MFEPLQSSVPFTFYEKNDDTRCRKTIILKLSRVIDSHNDLRNSSRNILRNVTWNNAGNIHLVRELLSNCRLQLIMRKHTILLRSCCGDAYTSPRSACAINISAARKRSARGSLSACSSGARDNQAEHWPVIWMRGAVASLRFINALYPLLRGRNTIRTRS